MSTQSVFREVFLGVPQIYWVLSPFGSNLIRRYGEKKMLEGSFLLPGEKSTVRKVLEILRDFGVIALIIDLIKRYLFR